MLTRQCCDHTTTIHSRANAYCHCSVTTVLQTTVDLEPTDDPASTEDPILMDANGVDTDEEEVEEEPPTATD